MATVRELRARRLLTQAELAAALGMTPSGIYRIESGLARPRYRTIRKIAEFFGVDPGELELDQGSRLLVRDLGWTEDEARETYYRLRSFREDWEAPGMEAYDELHELPAR